MKNIMIIYFWAGEHWLSIAAWWFTLSLEASNSNKHSSSFTVYLVKNLRFQLENPHTSPQKHKNSYKVLVKISVQAVVI